MDIKIENLSKLYGAQRAVDNISFEVKTGEVLGFLGPNGAGKTTTMKMITNYLAIDRGDIKIGGKSIKAAGEDLRQHIGYLPEHNPLYNDMPVLDYLAFTAALQGVPQHLIQAKIEEMVRVCGLDAEKHKLIGELSKGYRQRVGLAQAMIHDPEILILDEPTTGLDPNQIVEIRKLIKKIGKEKTVILSTHILPEVEATCDRILIINKGKIVADGTAGELRNLASGQMLIRATIEDGEINAIAGKVEALAAVAAVKVTGDQQLEIQCKPNTNPARDIFALCVENRWVLTEITKNETSLEDIFHELTTA